jgi:hypothetical protein
MSVSTPAKCIVYFIQAGENGPVKIGYTYEPEKRLIAMQGNHYEMLRILRVVPGNRYGERRLHQHFAHLRIRGEWFSFSEEMLTVAVEQQPTPPWMRKRDIAEALL